MTQITHTGIEYTQIRRFETDCFIHVIDLSKARLKLLNGFRTVPDAVTLANSQLGFNGGGWMSTSPFTPNEWLIIGGVVIHSKTKDFRPCMAFMRDGSFSIVNQPNFLSTLNCIGFDRRIAEAGIWNSKITDNASEPRTIYGKNKLGRLVVLVCEGRSPEQKGLTFAEVWSVMQEYDVTDCGNADGGYSSAAVNTAISPSLLNKTYLAEVPNRRVVYQVLFFATPTGEVPPVDPPVDPPPAEPLKIVTAKITLTMDDGSEVIQMMKPVE